MRGNTTFKTETNQPQNEPIYLYTVFDYDGDGNDLCYVNQKTQVVFDGVTYEPFPIKHESISENSKGEIDQVSVVVANVNRLFRAYLSQYEFRDKKVSICQVFRDRLSDSSAKLEDFYYISSISAETESISFGLTTKLDLLSETLPRRKYTRGDFPGIPSKRMFVG